MEKIQITDVVLNGKPIADAETFTTILDGGDKFNHVEFKIGKRKFDMYLWKLYKIRFNGRDTTDWKFGIYEKTYFGTLCVQKETDYVIWLSLGIAEKLFGENDDFAKFCLKAH